MAISVAVEETGEVAENTPVNKGAIGFWAWLYGYKT